jgi:hypothetical protein
MPSLTPKMLYLGVGSASNVYTSGSNVGDYSVIKIISVCNSNTTSPKTFSMHILTPTSNTANANNIVISNMSVPSSDVLQIDSSLVINNNSSIYISHSGNITTLISGVEYK